MIKYKLRAECHRDIICLLSTIGVHFNSFQCKKIFRDWKPDCELEFETQLPFADIIHNISEIPDGHVMMETIETKAQYTGIRI